MRTARRSLLACLPAALAPAAARAFRQEEASAEVAADYAASACGESHAALRGALERQLAGQPLPPDLAARLAELTRCPFCGCAVAGAPDHGEAREAEPG